MQRHFNAQYGRSMHCDNGVNKMLLSSRRLISFVALHTYVLVSKLPDTLPERSVSGIFCSNFRILFPSSSYVAEYALMFPGV